MSYKTPGRLALDVAQTLGTGVKLVILALNNLSALQRAAPTEIHGFWPSFSERVSSLLIKCEDSTWGVRGAESVSSSQLRHGMPTTYLQYER